MPVIVAGSHEHPYTSCTNVDMDMCVVQGYNYSFFGEGSTPSSGSAPRTTMQYTNIDRDHDLDDQVTATGRKTPVVSGYYHYPGFNLILYNPDPLGDIVGANIVCPGEERYCIAETIGFFYNWSITEGEEYATIVSDSTLSCVNVNFTNATTDTQRVTLRVDVSPPCCPSYDYRTYTVKVRPNVEITNISDDLSVCEGSPFDLSATATMPYSQATYQWLLNGAPVTGVMSEGSTVTTYHVSSADGANTGLYEVLASGPCNVDRDTVVVTLRPMPVVTVSIAEDPCIGTPVPYIFESNMDSVTITFNLYGQEHTIMLMEGANSYTEFPSDEILASYNDVLTVTSIVSNQNCTNPQQQFVLVVIANDDEATSAGPDRVYCSRTFNIEALRPIEDAHHASSGHWEVVSTNPPSAVVNIEDEDNHIASVTVDQSGQYEFEWILHMEIPCDLELRDTVLITVNDTIGVEFDRPLASCGDPITLHPTISGGAGEPYEIYWLDCQPTDTVVMGMGPEWSGLTVGHNYLLIVDDTSDCSTSVPFTIQQLEPPTVEIQPVDTLCPNTTEVELTVVIDGGNPSYEATFTFASGGITSETYTESDLPPYTTLYSHLYRPCNGKDTVYLYVLDGSDCKSYDTAVIVIADVRGPEISGTLDPIEISCRDSLPSEVSSLDELLALYGSGITIIDNCSSSFALGEVTTDPITAVCHTTYHRTYMVTDSCGNATAIVQDIIFNDVNAPVISDTLPNDTIYANANCTYTLPNAFTTVDQLIAAGLNITDCNLASEVTSADDNTDPITSCTKRITRTYTVSDSCGNAATVTQTIVVKDTVAPVVTTRLRDTILYYTGNDCTLADFPTLELTDFTFEDCSSGDMTMLPVTHSDTTHNGTGCEWSYVRTYSFEDACGNGPTKVRQTIHIQDTTRPDVVDNLHDTILYYSGNDCTLDAYPELTKNDFTIRDCNEVEMTFHADTTSGGVGCAWTITRIYTFTDECNNAAVSIDQVITVQDTTRPAISGTLESLTIFKTAALECGYLLPDTLRLDELQMPGRLTIEDCNLKDTVAVTHTTYELVDDCSGRLTRIYELFDRCGNSNTVSQTILVQDTTRPMVTTVLADTLRVYYTDAACSYTAPATLQLTDFEVLDCSPTIQFEVTHHDTTNGGTGCEWSYERTYTFNDGCGNAPVSLTQTILVKDTMRPSIPGELAADTVYSSDNCTYQLPDTLTVDDLQDSLHITDCNLLDDYVEVIHTEYENDGDCGGHIIRTYRIFDICGNSDTVQQMILVRDTTRPYFTEAIPTQLLAGTDCQFVIPDLADTVLRRVADNCTPADRIQVTGQTPAAGDPVTAAEQDVEVTVSDLCDNTNTITVHVTLPDTLRVTINQNDTSVCEGQSVTLPTSVEGGVSVSSFAWTHAADLDDAAAAAPVATPADTTTYVVTVTDANGCTATDTVTINVDTLPTPIRLSQEPNVACHGGANGSITIESPVPAGWYSYALDPEHPEDIANYQNTTNVYSGLQDGLHTIYVMTDATSHCIASDTITVENSPAIPSVTIHPLADDIQLCPNQGVQEIVASIPTGRAPFDVNWENVASTTDSVTAYVGIAATVCDSTYTVMIHIEDANGCEAHDTLRFHVTDTVAPTITGTLSDITIACRDSLTDVVTTVEALQELLEGDDSRIFDNCVSISGLQLSSVTDDITATCHTTYHRTYTVTDSCGKHTSIVQNIIFDDTDAPEVTGTLPNDTVYATANCAYVMPTAFTSVSQLTSLTITDCNLKDTVTYVDNDNTPLSSCTKEITRTYTVSDSCGNSTPIEQAIVVMDTMAPVVTTVLPDTILYYIGNDCTPASYRERTEGEFSTTVSDCNPWTMAVTYGDTNNADGTCEWSYRCYYTFTDACGNESESISQKIIVKDTTRPVVTTVLADTLRVYYTDVECHYTAPATLQLADFEVLDCSTDIQFEVTHHDTTNGGTGCEWSYERTYTFSDGCGNAPVSLTQTIVVEDTMRPSIEGELSAVTVYSHDNCTYRLPDTLTLNDLKDSLTIADCNLRENYVEVTHSGYEADGDCGGHIIRTYRIFDECGNSDTVGQRINVTDTTRPHLTEEIPTQLLAGTNCQFVIPNLADTVLRRVADNCTPADRIQVTEQTPAAGDPVAAAEQDVAVVISDLCGNRDTIMVHVTLPDTLRVTINQNDTSVCEGQSVTLPTTVIGGVENYSYQWTPADSITSATEGTVTVWPSDTTGYVVTVTDNNGCTATDTVTINVDTIPTPIVLSQTPNEACQGANGTITVESPVPFGWYNYALDPSHPEDIASYQDTINVYSGLQAGLHTIYVMTDVTSHCIASDTITVGSAPGQPTVAVNPIESQLCHTQMTQEVTATINSGIEPFEVTWTGATFSATDSLSATVYFDAMVCDSTYTVTVSIVDGNECQASNTYNFRVNDTVAPRLTGTIDTVSMEGCSADVVQASYPLAEDEDALLALSATISIADTCTPAGSFRVQSVSDTSGTCPIVVTRRYTVIDLCNNESNTLTQVILVHDSTAPEVTADSVTTELNGCGVSAAPAVAMSVPALEEIGFAVEDVCTPDDALEVRVKADTAGNCPIVLTRKYVAVDECGNVSDTMVHTISIFDSVAPVISRSAENLELYACDTSILARHLAAATVDQLVDLGFFIEEECSYDEMTVHHTVDSVGNCPITITRTYWVTDACGNESNTVTHTILINDTVHPMWHNAVMDTLLVSDNCVFVMPNFVAMAAASASDNCSDVAISQSVEAGEPVTAATTVTVTLADVCGNDTTYTVHVRVPDTLQVSIDLADTSVCAGQSVTLPTSVEGGVPVYSFAWTHAEDLNDADAAEPVATPSDTTTYVVTVTDNNGCTATDTVMVNVDTIPATPVLTQEPNVACHGEANGSIRITSPGPAGWYNYAIGNEDPQDTTNM